MLKIRVQNVACFNDSQQFEIKPGLNAFIGINNSGKTALLWAIAMLGCAMREETSEWATQLQSKIDGYRRGTFNPAVQVEFALPPETRDQQIEALCNLAGGTSYPPYDAVQETFEFNVHFNTSRNVSLAHPVRLHYNSGNSRVSTDIMVFLDDHSYRVSPPFGGNPRKDFAFQALRLLPMGEENRVRYFRFGGPHAPIAKCWPSALNSVCFLGANRDHTPRYFTKKDSLDLKPDAENLVQVLRTAHHSTRRFRGSRDAFQRIENAIRAVFPEVRHIRAETIDDRNENTQEDVAEIVLDLMNGHTVPLANCGAGLFQIVTLLTAAHLKPNASLFLIDEPHPYLHPAAERGLIRILEQLAKERGHIFCLATHSSIISSQCRKNLFAVINRGDDSNVVALRDTVDVLSVLGITNFDLFTYDKVLFVEGESDVSVFTLVLNAMGGRDISERTKIVDLSGDGKLKKTRSAHRLRKLLISASASKARVPVGFLLDSANRSPQEQVDMRKTLHEPPISVFELLERAELEDYLLDCKAIAQVLRNELLLSGSEDDPTLESRISTIISSAKEKGSVVLQKCFSDAIVGREYRKKDDAPVVAAEILATNAAFLKPLYDELRTMICSIGAPVSEQQASLLRSEPSAV